MQISCYNYKLPQDYYVTNETKAIQIATIYSNTLANRRKTPLCDEIINIATLVNEFFSENTQLSRSSKNIFVDLVIFETNLGCAENGFILNGLTVNIDDRYHILISNVAKKLPLKVIMHEFVHVYIDNVIGLSNIPTQKLEEIVEHHVELIAKRKGIKHEL